MELVNKTIGACFADRVKNTPDAIAIEFEGQKLTWAQLDLLSDWLVLRFKFFGMKQGSRAALWCGNCMQWVIVFMGLQKIGACAVLVNPGYREEELYSIIEYAKTEYIFYGESFKDISLSEMIDNMDLKRYPYLKQTIPIELDDAVKFMEEGASALLPEELSESKRIQSKVKNDDVACMLFTSGTTSAPKGVMLSHYNLVNCARATVKAMRWDETDKLCVMVPMFHCFGMTSSLISSIIAGSGLVLMKNTRSVTAMEAIEKCGCTVLNGVPSMFFAMIGNKDFDKYDLSSLKSGIIAGSKIKPDEYKEICAKLNLNHLQMSYGQTETSPGVSFSGYDQTIEEKADNAGYMVENIELCIWDKEGKQYIYSEEQLDIDNNNSFNTPYNISGEIGIRGYLVMQYYYDRPKETAKTLQEDGWLHTGDIGYLDENKLLHIEGRLKELIIRGGENISPGEIEESIMTVPGIKEVKVVGVSHPVLQEEIAAAVVLKDNTLITEDEIKEHVREHLAAYKVPQYIRFLDSLPKTVSGKIALGEIKKIMEEYCMHDREVCR